MPNNTKTAGIQTADIQQIIVVKRTIICKLNRATSNESERKKTTKLSLNIRNEKIYTQTL